MLYIGHEIIAPQMRDIYRYQSFNENPSKQIIYIYIFGMFQLIAVPMFNCTQFRTTCHLKQYLELCL